MAIAPENLAGADGVTVDPPALTPPPQQPRQRETRTQEAKEAEQRSAETVGPGDDLLPRPTDAVATRRRRGRQGGQADRRPTIGSPTSSGRRCCGRARSRRPAIADSTSGRSSRGGPANVTSTATTRSAPTSGISRRGSTAFVQDLCRSWIAPYRAYRLGISTGSPGSGWSSNGTAGRAPGDRREGRDTLRCTWRVCRRPARVRPVPAVAAGFPRGSACDPVVLHYPRGNDDSAAGGRGHRFHAPRPTSVPAP